MPTGALTPTADASTSGWCEVEAGVPGGRLRSGAQKADVDQQANELLGLAPVESGGTGGEIGGRERHARRRSGEPLPSRQDDLRSAPLALAWIIERIPHRHRYELTTLGLRVALFFSRTYTRLLRPILSEIAPNAPPGHSPIRTAFERIHTLIDQACQEARLATV